MKFKLDLTAFVAALTTSLAGAAVNAKRRRTDAFAHADAQLVS